jgi:cyclophilin family peptidyl-prolyl cis-trans isomerase
LIRLILRKPLWFLAAVGAFAVLAACQSATPSSGAKPGLGTPAATPLTWSSTPTMVIDKAKIYVATFRTSKGDFRLQLYADKAPNTVNNFVFLARQGYYNHTTFHRVLKDTMAQGGDPTGTGTGGPGYTFADEIDPDLKFDKPGVVGMANYGPNTNGSQFFITFTPQPMMNGSYPIFGQVVSGMDKVLTLKLRDPSTNPDYYGDEIYSITIEESPISLLPVATATNTPKAPVPTHGVRSLATMQPTARANLFSGPPAMVINPNHTYRATVETTKGNIIIDLYTRDAPQSVNNFVVLAKMGYWDAFPINYVDPYRFVLTGGPAGNQETDIGYTIPIERGRPNVTGAVGYWIREGET